MSKNTMVGVGSIVATIVLGFLLVFMFVVNPQNKESEVVTGAGEVDKEKEVTLEDSFAAYKPPSMEDVPAGELGDLIKKGYSYTNDTSTTLDGYVGNTLSCASCHADGGAGEVLDLVGITKTHPKYNPRAGKVVTIEERINGCFKRSLNGKPLSPEGPEMKAMVAYFDYISQNVPDGTKERPWAKLKIIEGDLPTPNINNGRDLYVAACASCHGQNGEGANNGLAVWGENSYNIGAGMARLRTAAGFIQSNMPKVATGGYEKGSLTDQEAIDIAAYINEQYRPDFPGKEKDWPKGDAPDDAAYETLAKKVKQ